MNKGISFLHLPANNIRGARIYVPASLVNLASETCDLALESYLTTMALWGGKDTEMIIEDKLWLGYEFSTRDGVESIPDKLAHWDSKLENDRIAGNI